MTSPPIPITVQITGLISHDGLGLVRCERCRSHVDATDVCVGTVTTERVNSSVLLCSRCATTPDTEAWLIEHLTGPSAPRPACDVA